MRREYISVTDKYYESEYDWDSLKYNSDDMYHHNYIGHLQIDQFDININCRESNM